MAISPQEKTLTTQQHLVYFCSRFLAYALPLLFFLVTCSFYLKTYDSAQVKITFTQIGTAVLLFVWLAKILIEGRWPFQKNDWVYVAPFVAFLASGLIVWLHTPFKAWSLEETLRRVFYMVLALVAIAEMRSSERMKRLWRWLMAAAWVAIGYGLVQYIDSRWFKAPSPIPFDPFIWRQAFSARVFSTFGNPNFYGNFLVIVTPLILSSVLKNKGSLIRPFVTLAIMCFTVFFIEKMMMDKFGGFDSSFRIVFYFFITVGLGFFLWSAFYKVGSSLSLSFFLILFALLFLNLYSTETKGAWLGFTVAIGATMWLIMEYFLHLEDRVIDPQPYSFFILAFAVLSSVLMTLMVKSFVIPLFNHSIKQVGFSILWIPTAIMGLILVAILIWVLQKPWNLKKIVYGILILCLLSMGGGVLEFAKNRLLSVSFRLFTWISTFEMIKTHPILGNGVGTFKVIYPAYRRPQIIVLEGKSNTETDHSEDEYIETWQDEGIVGFGILLWMIITALVCGFKQLRWYSKLRVPDQTSKRTLLHLESDPRSYEVLGILGAYIGALFHWCVDVSIRFVSSGVFSGLLPGLLVAYARNHNNPIRHEVRLSYDRWIRFSVAAFWTAVMLALRMELVPDNFIQGGDTSDLQIWGFAILMGLAIFGLMELLEIGIQTEKDVPFAEQYGEMNPSFIPVRMVMLIMFGFVLVKGLFIFSDQFQADVHHNLAIFFSKNSIWSKAPKYEAMLNNYPPDIRKKYQQTGGALEHYAEVVKDNPAFPMAHYFTGNVYNDWGSQFYGEALAVRQKGDQREADRLKDNALAMWDKAETAYNSTKSLAPNYVQTHHQMGLLDVKRAEISREWKDPVQEQRYYSEAYKNFALYRMLDPVFPPNCDRMAQILLMQGKFDEAIKLYQETIYYNDVVAKSIIDVGFTDRVSELSVSLAKVYITKANNQNPNPFNPRRPDITSALQQLQIAVDNNPKNAEAWKLMGMIYERGGEFQKSQDAYHQVLNLNPKDADLKNSLPAR